MTKLDEYAPRVVIYATETERLRVETTLGSRTLVHFTDSMDVADTYAFDMWRLSDEAFRDVFDDMWAHVPEGIGIRRD